MLVTYYILLYRDIQILPPVYYSRTFWRAWWLVVVGVIFLGCRVGAQKKYSIFVSLYLCIFSLLRVLLSRAFLAAMLQIPSPIKK